MRNVMIDLETFGTRPGSVIVSIGAVEFSMDGIGEAYYRAIDVASSLLAGLTIDEITVKWWREQDILAQRPLIGGSAIGLVLYRTRSRRHR